MYKRAEIACRRDLSDITSPSRVRCRVSGPVNDDLVIRNERINQAVRRSTQRSTRTADIRCEILIFPVPGDDPAVICCIWGQSGNGRGIIRFQSLGRIDSSAEPARCGNLSYIYGISGVAGSITRPAYYYGGIRYSTPCYSIRRSAQGAGLIVGRPSAHPGE